LDFFKKKSYLTVSGQLNGEIYACALGSIYTFGPTFRAEDANTSRHLAEFWMIEPEIAFADLTENMDIAEQYVKFTLNYVLKHSSEELQYLEEYERKNLEELKKQHDLVNKETKKCQGMGKGGEQNSEGKQPKGGKGGKGGKEGVKQQGKGKLEQDGTKPEAGGKKSKQPPQKDIRGFRLQPLRLQHVATTDFARITYTNAIEILQKSDKTFEKNVEWGMDLGSEHERWLAESHFCRPVIVHDYPIAIKAFYMRANEDGRTVAAMDVLVPGVGELIGGSQREERLEVLLARMRECNLDPEGYSFYLDLRRFGSVPHAGFGLGFERLVCFATGTENIRDAIPFPRYPGHADY